jgi:hypothetical protein
MFRKIIARKSAAWMLAETICCLAIALTVSACVLDTSAMLTAISKKSHSKRKSALDMFSIMHETGARFETCQAGERGNWRAAVTGLRRHKGMTAAEIFVISSEDGENARWKQWKIDGRE